jgi:FkbM family methyltransferase
MMNKIVKSLLSASGMKSTLDRYLDRYINESVDRLLNEKLQDLYFKLRWNEAVGLREEKINKFFEEGFILECYTDSHLSKKLYTENFEENEKKFVKQFLKPGDTFIDIGANIGLFTVYASKLVEQQGKVFAFEPNPRTFERLKSNIQLNASNNVELYQKGVSDSSGQLQFIISKDGYDAWDSFGRPSAGEDFETISVPVISLNEFLAREQVNGQKVSLIKIDVEGWEEHVISGGEGYLKSDSAPTLLIEFTEINLENAGTNSKSLYNFITNLGYSFYRYDNLTNRLLEEPYRGPYPYNNLIAVKDLNKAQRRLIS